MKTILFLLKINVLAVVLLAMAAGLHAQSVPTEFTFTNAVLASGSPNADGAVYRFSNVAPGIDALVTIVGRSASNVVLDTIDIPPVSGMGFDNALQPQLGIKGNVPAFSNWWMKFQLNFVKAGTTKALSIDKFNATAIDVDGDNVSIAENVKMDKATSISLSPYSVLTVPATPMTACPKDAKLGLPVICPTCLGLGFTTKKNGKTQNCNICNNTGYLFSTCGHPWSGSDIAAAGTIQNAVGIDTNAVNNMATFTYNSTDQITFTYGAASGAVVSNAGVRLNSLWFKSFPLQPSGTLPLHLTDFSAAYQSAGVILKWTTASEKNFSHFELERSTNGKTYDELAVVFSGESTAAEKNYAYTDKSVNTGIPLFYYRLKMVDLNGAVTYSQVQVIRLTENKNTVSVVAYPNPVTDRLLLTMPSGWTGQKAVAQLYTSCGILVKSVPFASVNNNETIDMAQLNKGVYVLNISCQDKSVQTKILKN